MANQKPPFNLCQFCFEFSRDDLPVWKNFQQKIFLYKVSLGNSNAKVLLTLLVAGKVSWCLSKANSASI